MSSTIDAIKDQPGLAKFQFRARNIGTRAGAIDRSSKSFTAPDRRTSTRTAPFVLDADEPPVLLGEDRGANPVEFVLHALAACLTTSLVYHAAARGIHIERVESSLEGRPRLAWGPRTFWYRAKGVSEHPCCIQSQERRTR